MDRKSTLVYKGGSGGIGPEHLGASLGPLKPVWASRVEIDGSPYLVAAVGYDGLAAREAAMDALAGVARIFKATAQAA